MWDDSDDSRIYSPDGQRISLREWAILREVGGDGEGEIRVAEDFVLHEKKHKGGFWVSTVWLGLDHNFGFGPPVIFESMAFTVKPARWNDVVLAIGDNDRLMERYVTRDAALLGHAVMVEQAKRMLKDQTQP